MRKEKWEHSNAWVYCGIDKNSICDRRGQDKRYTMQIEKNI